MGMYSEDREECLCGRSVKIDPKFYTNITRLLSTLQSLQQKGWEVFIDPPSYENNFDMRFVCPKCKVKGDIKARIQSN